MGISGSDDLEAFAGIIGGFAPLDSGVLVPTSYLPVYLRPPVCAVVRRSNVGSDLTTGSTTFVDIDSANLTATITTLDRRVRLSLSAVGTNTGTNLCGITFSVDGVIVVNNSTSNRGIKAAGESAASSGRMELEATFLTDVLSAGSHTFRPMWKTSAGTQTALQTATTDLICFTVEETWFTS